MIDFYGFETGNAKRVAIALEEAGLDYEYKFVNLFKGEQRNPDFLALNPRGSIPVIVDHDGPGGEPITLSQSFAITQYIAQKSGKLLPTDPRALAHCQEWCSLVVTDISGASLQSFYLKVISKVKHPEAAEVLNGRALHFFKFADQQLGESAYLAGNDYTLADILAFPTAMVQTDNPALEDMPHLTRWMAEVGARPAVKKALEVLAPKK